MIAMPRCCPRATQGDGMLILGRMQLCGRGPPDIMGRCPPGGPARGLPSSPSGARSGRIESRGAIDHEAAGVRGQLQNLDRRA
jgi:hypothetical protein